MKRYAMRCAVTRPDGSRGVGVGSDGADLEWLLSYFWAQCEALAELRQGLVSGEVWEEGGAVIVRCQVSIDGGVP